MTHEGHSHHDAQRWIETLDDPARDAWQRPAEVLAALALTEGLVVADVGAGTGWFAPHLSRAVGPRGKVLALDVDPELVAHMQRRFHDTRLHNVDVRRIEPARAGLAPRTVDRVLIVDAWHHFHDRVEYARTLRAALAPGGRVVIVDYPLDAPDGPPVEMRLDERAVLAELQAAGFQARLAPARLPRQYVVIGEAP